MDFISTRKIFTTFISSIIIIITLFSSLSAQGVSENETRYVRIGELQSLFSAYGSERGWNNTFYEGLKWPAQYPYTDNFVIKRTWIAIEDYTDENGEQWDHWANYIYKGNVRNTIYPMELKQSAKFKAPTVYVDGENITQPYVGDVDTIITDQIADRVITNVVNLSSGITLTRRILAFSQQYHDNYFIKEITIENSGNTDYDPEIERPDSITGLRVGWGSRYASREGAMNSDNQGSWGKHSWVTRRGEDYKEHAEEVRNFTEETPIDQLGLIRCTFSWMGQSELVDYDMIGAPDMDGQGRLTANQFAGTAVLHVDKSANNQEDDPDQPAYLGWHAGDTYPSLGQMKKSDMVEMGHVYRMLSGVPYPSEGKGGQNRFYEDNTTSIIDRQDPYKIHGDGGGTNTMLGYGPFDLAHGESVTIVEAEGVSGISRTKCIDIGQKWLKENGPYELPPNGVFSGHLDGNNYGETTDDPDVYKNAWVYTGVDSLLRTFSRALMNYNMDYQISQPPLPPELVEVNSGGDKIMLNWAPSPSEGESNFGGYRIYRAVGTPDTIFEKIAELPPGTESYEDKGAKRGFSYYYYLVSHTDGSIDPRGRKLESGKFYTMTNKAAYLRRKAGESLDDIRVVPNPFNIRAKDQQYTGEPNKLMFLDIPAYCKISIYTERGDKIKTIHHDDGSGDETWRLTTSSRQTVVSGVYIAVFEVTQDYKDLYKKGDTTFEKFVVIR